MEGTKNHKIIIDILKASETMDIDPPHRVMPAGYSNKWYEFKANRIHEEYMRWFARFLDRNKLKNSGIDDYLNSNAIHNDMIKQLKKNLKREVKNGTR